MTTSREQRSFSVVEDRIHHDPVFRGLSLHARYLWLCLLTSDRRVAPIEGLIKASVAEIADDVIFAPETPEGLPGGVQEVRAAFVELEAARWVFTDWPNRLILMPKVIRRRPPWSWRNVKGWGPAFDRVPGSPLKEEWLRIAYQVVQELPLDKQSGNNLRLEVFIELFGTQEAPQQAPSQGAQEGSYKGASQGAQGAPLDFPLPDPLPFPVPLPDPKEEKTGGSKGGGNQEPLQLLSGKNPQEKTSPQDAFDRFWKKYPKKAGKKVAKKAFERARKSKDWPGLDAILAAIKSAKASEQWREGYIHDPATWLNQGRWDDEHPTGGQGGSAGDDRGRVPVPPPAGLEVPEGKTVKQAISEAKAAGADAEDVSRWEFEYEAAKCTIRERGGEPDE